MKIALIGASGRVGSRILDELVRRGHDVTAIVRQPEKVPVQPHVIAKRGDVADSAGLAVLIAGHDAAITSVRFIAAEPRSLIDAVKASGVKRYLVVGGAGSLDVAPGQRLYDTPDFPATVRPESAKGGEFLDLLRQEPTLNWTFLSPSATIAPGERTGKFRLGGDRLLTDDKGVSAISFEDFAVALVDELEKPAHPRQRFTVGY